MCSKVYSQQRFSALISIEFVPMVRVGGMRLSGKVPMQASTSMAYKRPREAPLDVSGKFAYFWASNWPYLSGELHIFGLPGRAFEQILGVFCIFFTDFWLNFADFCGGVSYGVLDVIRF
jgi:hypothetical protein